MSQPQLQSSNISEKTFQVRLGEIGSGESHRGTAMQRWLDQKRKDEPFLGCYIPAAGGTTTEAAYEQGHGSGVRRS